MDKENKDHFVLCLEVDDPDEPINNPSMSCVLPKAPDTFFGAPGKAGRAKCERWMLNLSEEWSIEKLVADVNVYPECFIGGGLSPLLHRVLSRGSERETAESNAARHGICFGCEETVGRKHLKKCAGCNRVAYCSRECQTADWKAHKPCCERRESA